MRWHNFQTLPNTQKCHKHNAHNTRSSHVQAAISLIPLRPLPPYPRVWTGRLPWSCPGRCPARAAWRSRRCCECSTGLYLRQATRGTRWPGLGLAGGLPSKRCKRKQQDIPPACPCRAGGVALALHWPFHKNRFDIPVCLKTHRVMDSLCSGVMGLLPSDIF